MAARASHGAKIRLLLLCCCSRGPGTPVVLPARRRPGKGFQNLRIALLVNGMTGYLNAEFEALQRLGNELLVVTPGSPDVAVGAMADTAFEGLRTERFAMVRAWDTQPDPAELVAMVEEFEPDAVLMTSWNFSRAYRAVMKAVPATVVRVLIMDNLWRAAPRQWLGRATHRWYVDPVADAVLVPSDRSEFYARRLGFGAGDIIRGSISADTRLFHSPTRTAEDLGSRRRFLYVGRLVDHKGADVLAAAYRRYRELVEDPWDLDVAGIGPLEPLLRSIPGVTLHGFVQPPGIAELMREVSCFVLTSHIEPYGVVVHEAAASALPILCSDFHRRRPRTHPGRLQRVDGAQRRQGEMGGGHGSDERLGSRSPRRDVGGQPLPVPSAESRRLGPQSRGGAHSSTGRWRRTTLPGLVSPRSSSRKGPDVHHHPRRARPGRAPLPGRCERCSGRVPQRRRLTADVEGGQRGPCLPRVPCRVRHPGRRAIRGNIPTHEGGGAGGRRRVPHHRRLHRSGDGRRPVTQAVVVRRAVGVPWAASTAGGLHAHAIPGEAADHRLGGLEASGVQGRARDRRDGHGVAASGGRVRWPGRHESRLGREADSRPGHLHSPLSRPRPSSRRTRPARGSTTGGYLRGDFGTQACRCHLARRWRCVASRQTWCSLVG